MDLQRLRSLTCIVTCLTLTVECWTPQVLNGRPAGGFVIPPQTSIEIDYPVEQYYEFQAVNHFDGSDFRLWKQRYFVNDTYLSKDGTIFLVLGGEAELNPIWAVEGAWIQYAQQHGAMLVLLEHRYYGKSQPVKDLSTDNLQYLSSRQAIADAAQFVMDYKAYHYEQKKVIVFGASYAGNLALWFRSKYPAVVNGAVASSPHILVAMDFIENFVSVTNILDSTTPTCSSEIRKATNTLSNWWNREDKRTLISEVFKLCDKIDHNLLADFSVFFYTLAENIGNVVQYNKDNMLFEEVSGERVTIDTLCNIMTDESRGDSVQRYADVNTLLLNVNKESCLNIRYTKTVQSLNYTELDNATTHKGERQWLYQMCSELGLIHTSSSPKQPFGQYFCFPFNYTTRQCIDLFDENNTKGIFGGGPVIENCIATNRYYGGRDIPISYAILVNHELDPWRNMTNSQHLPYSQNTDILDVKGTAHIADIYPPSDGDPPELTQARETISQTIGKWDLSTDNLHYLSSRQAIADAAQFVMEYKAYHYEQKKVIVFGASYAGNLALWFRSKYPAVVNGAVASSPHLLVAMDFIEYFVSVTHILDSTTPKCSSEIRKATNTLSNWWNQEDKRPIISEVFKLCDKIDHNLLADFSVFFYTLAENFGNVVQYNKDNILFKEVSGERVTIDTLCNIMTDESRGDSVQRYADVNTLLLNVNKESCLNIRYTKTVQSLNYTELDNATTHKGERQWLYQMCSELGLIHTSSSPKQPFGQYFCFPFNYTTRQCIDLFDESNTKGIFGGGPVIENCIATNRYYGGRDLPISYAILVNHELDPWRNMTNSQHLPYSQNTDILDVKGTAHIADIYPPSDGDPPELTQARETISQTIGKWLAGDH